MPRPRADLQALLTGYAGSCQGLALAENKALYLIMHDNVRILYDDGKVKSFEEKLDHPDLQDMLSQRISGRRVPGIPA